MKSSIAFGKCTDMVIPLRGPFVAAGLAAGWRSCWQMARTKKENSLGSQDGMNRFCPTGKSLLIFRNRVPEIKNISLRRRPKSDAYPFPSRPDRGAFRDRHGRWAGDAVDAAASGEQQRAGRMMLKRTAKSCGSDAPMLASR